MSDPRSSRRWLILFTATAVPVALGVEALARAFLLPPEFEEVRHFLGPTMTVFAWAMVVVTLAMVLLGILLQLWMTRRAVRRATQQGRAVEEARASMGPFLIAASLPQAPAILAGLSLLAGAEVVPVLLAVGLSTAGVCIQAAMTTPRAA
jgi:hypothetical protein